MRNNDIKSNIFGLQMDFYYKTWENAKVENHWNQLANYEKIILNHAIPTCQKSGYASWHVIDVESRSLHTNSSNCLKKYIWAHQLFNFTRSSAFCQ